MIFEIENLNFEYSSHIVLKDLNLSVLKGEFFSIIGPNGTGKSTLLRLMAGFLKPSRGNIKFMGYHLQKFNPLELARKRAFVSQDNFINFPYTAYEIVLMGRFPYLRNFQIETKEDHDIVRSAMEKTSTTHIATRSITDLSGGERQRVMIAKALAQNPSVLLLDEPTSGLDINYQIDIMDHLRLLNRHEKVTIIMVIHDLNLAGQYSDRILLLSKGRTYATGSPEEVITEQNIEEVFSLKVNIDKEPERGFPRLMLISRVL
ncbi:MAG TPA: heme ABC transporter ATP-binding protein [Candidatus Eremiobacteraeota bacterium]|nr:MAG: Hemin import ATP-binding protein HmuV [bacterium ADurb.Bin363]HPZ06992.1 heme ABC transporter ATP-binding protein [Candidatus Eremiobacteraeota bacterium]